MCLHRRRLSSTHEPYGSRFKAAGQWNQVLHNPRTNAYRSTVFHNQARVPSLYKASNTLLVPAVNNAEWKHHTVEKDIYKRNMLAFLIASCLVGSLEAQVGFLIGGSVPSTSAPWTKPWFCHKLECPRYTVLETNDKFETRRYEPSVWVGSVVSTSSYDSNGFILSNNNLFFKNFHYISGSNSASMKIAMTAPVLAEVDMTHTGGTPKNFSEYFMVPFAIQANPPTPTEAGVNIYRKPAMTVYVISYSGYSSNDQKFRYTQSLMAALDAAGKRYRRDVIMTAGYDGPYTFTERHNEIWIMAQ